MPFTVPVPAVGVTEIVDDPSKLPIVFPVIVPMSNRPALVPSIMATNPVVVPVPVDAVVWLIPEITFPWMLVATAVATEGASMPLKVFVDPEIVVVPVPLAAPKPMTLPVTANEPIVPAVEFKVIAA